MIRLAEAMARMDISDDVQPKHVKEAYRLLNKSIIRVEQPDIHLDSGDQDELPEDETSQLDRAQTPTSQMAKKKMVLSFEEYKHLSNLIVLFMRKQEATFEEQGRREGTHRSDVVQWYLNHIEDTIESADELVEKKDMLEKVLDRLIYHVSFLFFTGG